MNTLDWGQVTAEGADVKSNKFVYVFNHDLSSLEKIERTIRFVLGRLNHYDKHLPPDPQHAITFDLRGQEISDEYVKFISKDLMYKYPRKSSLIIDCKYS